MEFWHCFVFWKQCVYLAIKIRFSIVILCRWVLERCLYDSFKDCHRQTPKPVVWIYSLTITPQPNGAISSHRKRWMVSTGLKHHRIMRKQRFQHLKALFIHFMQFYGPWITHKKWHSNTFRASFKMTKKSLLVTFSTTFFFAVSLGNKASKMSEKFRLDSKIGFRNAFYTNCINVIIVSIGPSIILRSTRKEPTQARKYFMIVNLPLFCI